MTREMLLHGGALDLMRSRYPEAPEPWLDLSTGINPWPYDYAADTRHAAAHLPTEAAFDDCGNAMASAFGTASEHLLLAPGSELLIRLLPDVLDATRVVVASESYGDHKSTWQKAASELLEAEDPLLLSETSDVVVVCNPNNPDGRSWSKASLEAARKTLAAKGGWLIVDEAYMDLSPDASMIGEEAQDGLIVLRSFGKFFGLAGVRLGAIFAPKTILDSLAAKLGVWPVAGPTLAIGSEAYRDIEWQDATRERLAAARAALDEVLTRNGLQVAGGTDLFRFVTVDAAERLWQGLGEQGIYTRYFSWSDHSLRIGLPATEAALERLDAALRLSQNEDSAAIII